VTCTQIVQLGSTSSTSPGLAPVISLETQNFWNLILRAPTNFLANSWNQTPLHQDMRKKALKVAIMDQSSQIQPPQVIHNLHLQEFLSVAHVDLT